MFLSFLTVIRIRAVLPHIVLFDEERIHRGLRIDTVRHERHFCHVFHYCCVVNGVGGRCAPGEGSVVLDEDARGVVGVVTVEPFNDDIAGFEFVVAFDFLF